MFEFLTNKFEDLFYKIKNKGKLSPSDLDNALREIKLALLEADVNFKVVKEFLNNVKEKALGSDVLESITPTQQVIKIVNDEIIKMLGSSSGNINFSNKPPTILMLMGLQGAGKTTAVVKLASLLKTRFQKSVSVIASDVYRPAAILQLEDMAKKIDVEVYSEKGTDPVKICRNGVNKLTKSGHDVIIIDTAGRLQIDEKMMNEIKEIKKIAKPHQVYMVLDAMTGQEAINIAVNFNDTVECDGIILTKMDSDTRGGAALSVYYVIQKPVRFVSNGEKIEDFDFFYPDRMASRILGKGDVLTLVENAEKVISREKAEKLEKRMLKNELNFEDFMDQIKSIKKMGSLKSIFSMLPMAGKGKALKNIDLDDSQIVKMESMISSMTVYERRNPNIINGSRRKRIAAGSGRSVNDVNKLLKQFSKTKQMIKQFSRMGQNMNIPFDEI